MPTATARRRALPRAFAAVAAVALLATACAESDEPGRGAGDGPGTRPRPTLPEPERRETGPEGVGDPYFPNLGNGGYDVSHYGLELAYDPATDVLAGTATIEAEATERLASFHLDLRELEVESVTVDGAGARFSRDGSELVVRPAQPVTSGAEFTTVVAYSGVPQPEVAASIGVEIGWVATSDGAFALNEPDGAQTWFPSNDHPSDKASYTFRLTVPDPFVAVANGILSEKIAGVGQTTYVWEAADPMASYLALVAVGDFVIEETSGPDGLPIRNVFDRELAAEGREATESTAEMIEFFSEEFGPYPFETYGSLIVPGVSGVAFEAQTLSLYGPDSLGVSPFAEVVFPHELAHQWFGDAVTLERWRDIWLNEGFATYAEWLWLEHEEGVPLARQARSAYEELEARGVGPPPGDPGVDELFAGSVYLRGALTLYALRAEVGEDVFSEVLRTYYQRYEGESVSTDDFVDVAEDVSGTQLDALFATWLFSPELPPFPGGAG